METGRGREGEGEGGRGKGRRREERPEDINRLSAALATTVLT